MPDPRMNEDQLHALAMTVGGLQGRVEQLVVRLGQDNQHLEHRIASAANDAREAASAVSRCDDAARELALRVRDLERSLRLVRAIVAWLAGLVTVILAGVGVAAARGWLGLA